MGTLFKCQPGNSTGSIEFVLNVGLKSACWKNPLSSLDKCGNTDQMRLQKEGCSSYSVLEIL